MPDRICTIIFPEIDQEDWKMLRRIPQFPEVRFLPLECTDELQDLAALDIEAFASRRVNAIRAEKRPCDGIFLAMEYPMSLMVPVMREELALAGPSLEAVCKCEHKYWSRLLQSAVVPEACPAFELIDPHKEYRPDEVPLAYPFWLKPNKSYMSYLGFRIGNFADLERALEVARRELPSFAAPFNRILRSRRFTGPGAQVDAGFMLAEELMSGHQCTVEGYVHGGCVTILGVVDTVRFPNRKSFRRFDYPSKLPKDVKQRIGGVISRFLQSIRFDNSMFNAEFFVQPDGGVKIIEVNSRLSPQFCDLFEMVDGINSYEIVVALALNKSPRDVRRAGRFRTAASFVLRRFSNALVKRVPTPDELQAIEEEFPDAYFTTEAEVGKLLSDAAQDSYSFRYGLVNLGGRDREDLFARFERLAGKLNFEFEEVP